MTSKYNEVFKRGKREGEDRCKEYSNFYLNRLYSEQGVSTSKTEMACNHKHKFINNYKLEKKIQQLTLKKASNMDSLKALKILSDGDQRYEASKKLMKDGELFQRSSSTLSLDIAKYEKSIESSVEINSSIKIASTEQKVASFSHQDQFEFPRQNEDGNKCSKPQIMQFKASQKLLSPNQESPALQRPPSSSLVQVESISTSLAPIVSSPNVPQNVDKDRVEVPFKSDITTPATYASSPNVPDNVDQDRVEVPFKSDVTTPATYASSPNVPQNVDEDRVEVPFKSDVTTPATYASSPNVPDNVDQDRVEVPFKSDVTTPATYASSPNVPDNVDQDRVEVPFKSDVTTPATYASSPNVPDNVDQDRVEVPFKSNVTTPATYASSPNVPQNVDEDRVETPVKSDVTTPPIEVLKQASMNSADESVTDEATLTVDLQSLILKGQKDSYCIEKADKLGQGAFAKVLLAKAVKTEKQVAIKLIKGGIDILMEKDVLQKASSSSSNHLQKLEDYGTFTGTINNITKSYQFLALQLHGKSVGKFIEDCTMPMKIKVLIQSLEAIEELRKIGFKNDDLKKENFIMGRPGSKGEYNVILTDYGMCQSVDGKDIVKINEAAMNELDEALGGSENNENDSGRKHELRDWIIMALEMLDVEVEDQEGDKVLVLQEVTWRHLSESAEVKLKMKLIQNLSKLYRYVELLKACDVPDFNRMKFFLQTVEETLDALISEEGKACFVELKKSDSDTAAKFRKNFEPKPCELALLQKHCFTKITKPDKQDLAFFSVIEKRSTGKYIKNVEYDGLSLNFFRWKTNKTIGVFGCNKCPRKRCISIEVKVNGSENTWDKAELVCEPDEKDLKNCNGFKKLQQQ